MYLHSIGKAERQDMNIIEEEIAQDFHTGPHKEAKRAPGEPPETLT